MKFTIIEEAQAIALASDPGMVLRVERAVIGARARFAPAKGDGLDQFVYAEDTRTIHLAINQLFCLTAKDGVLSLARCDSQDIWQRFGAVAQRPTKDKHSKSWAWLAIVATVLLVGVSVASCCVIRRLKQKLAAEREANAGTYVQVMPTAPDGVSVVVGRPVGDQGNGAAQATTGTVGQTKGST